MHRLTGSAFFLSTERLEALDSQADRVLNARETGENSFDHRGARFDERAQHALHGLHTLIRVRIDRSPVQFIFQAEILHRLEAAVFCVRKPFGRTEKRVGTEIFS